MHSRFWALSIKAVEGQANSMQILCIVQDATKSFSKLRKLGHWKKNCFQTDLCLKNCFFVKKTPRNFLLKVNKDQGMPVLSRNLKIQYLREKQIPYKSPALSKRQPNLFQICANWTNKRFQNKLYLGNSFFIPKLQGNYF